MSVIWLCFCVSLLTVSSSAPTAEDEEQGPTYKNVDGSQIYHLRGERLNNNIYTTTPWDAAAAVAANIPVARSPEAYAIFVSPEARYYVPNAIPGYAGNMFRVEHPYENAREMLRYWDTNFMEQDVPMARFAYRNAPSTYVFINTPNIGYLNGHYNVQTGGSACGVFPSGRVGNGNLPLLLRCSPSLVTGQMDANPPSFSAGAVSHPDAYGDIRKYYSQQVHHAQNRLPTDAKL